MEELQGEGFKETLINYLKRLKEWLKPNPLDSLFIQSLKMIYKAAAVVLLIIFSPVIILVLALVFFAVL